MAKRTKQVPHIRKTFDAPYTGRQRLNHIRGKRLPRVPETIEELLRRRFLAHGIVRVPERLGDLAFEPASVL
jgi:hypothetical protein